MHVAKAKQFEQSPVSRHALHKYLIATSPFHREFHTHCTPIRQRSQRVAAATLPPSVGPMDERHLSWDDLIHAPRGDLSLNRPI